MSKVNHQEKYLYAGGGIDFVDGVAGRAARLPVQIVALHEYWVIAEAPQPDVALAAQIQLNTFADV